MTVATNAGNKFYVSTTATAPATYDAAGYAALTYAEVGEITDCDATWLEILGHVFADIVCCPSGVGNDCNSRTGGFEIFVILI